MNNETSKTSTPAAASPLTAKPGLVKNIGGTTFDIHIHFSENSRETFTDKVVRLWSYVKKKYKLNMPFLRLAYPAKASAFSSNAASYASSY